MPAAMPCTPTDSYLVHCCPEIEPGSAQFSAAMAHVAARPSLERIIFDWPEGTRSVEVLMGVREDRTGECVSIFLKEGGVDIGEIQIEPREARNMYRVAPVSDAIIEPFVVGKDEAWFDRRDATKTMRFDDVLMAEFISEGDALEFAFSYAFSRWGSATFTTLDRGAVESIRDWADNPEEYLKQRIICAGFDFHEDYEEARRVGAGMCNGWSETYYVIPSP